MVSSLSDWNVVKRCPSCGSANVRRSGISRSEARSHSFHSPYRCQSCECRFWVLSRKTRIGTAAAGACGLFVLIATSSMMHSRAGELWARIKADTIGAPDQQKAHASRMKDGRLTTDTSHVDASTGRGNAWAAQDYDQ